ncbi:MAG TPA: Mur ligase family protein [Patescibacteria group bacterium]|nr:Mur ligase family protein [Patescibacteria group bacterium]
MEEIQGKSVLIVGYGREGKSVAAWLRKHYPALQIDITDKQKDGDNYLGQLKKYDTVIRSPGVSPYLPEIQQYITRGGHLTSPTNIFFSRVTGITIGITGTKGKSTTTSLIAHILTGRYPDVRLVGNIGSPMLDALDTAVKDTIFVVELSSHQLVDIRYSPHIAVLLNIVPEHLDYYPNFEAYRQAKENIFRFQKPGDHLVRSEKTNEIFTTKLLGNRENISVAVRVARLMHVPDEMIQKQLATFAPLPHRLEFVGEFRGIRFYNDSLATIPEATIHALGALGSDVATLIAGGYDRSLDFSKLGEHLASHPVQTLILFPDTGEKIWKATQAAQATLVTQVKQQTQKFDVNMMEEAVRLAYEHTPVGNICLLSPASASYNLFRDYADRGNQFKEWVLRLSGA